MRLHQTTRNQETQTVGFASSETADGVTFSGGVMHVDGAPQAPDEVQKWASSNGLTAYTTVSWRDPATGARRASCNCPGWAVKKAGKPRRCCHTDDLTGVAPCRKRKVEDVTIRTIAEAEDHIPKLEGRRLRSIILD